MLGPEDYIEVMGPGYRTLGCQIAAINMPTKKSKTPSKDDYDELAIEYEQQKRQNEQIMMVLEAKEKELQQQGDRLANLELQMKAMAEAIRQGQHHGRQGLQLAYQLSGCQSVNRRNPGARVRQFTYLFIDQEDG